MVVHLLSDPGDLEALSMIARERDALVVALSGSAPAGLPAGVRAVALAAAGGAPGSIGDAELVAKVFEAERVYCW